MQRFTWNGEAMVPAKPKLADKTYVIGQQYWLEETSERSWISHRHEFAFVRKAWENLPDAIAERFRTPEHLRKAALIATGWHNEVILHAESAAEARRLAAYTRLFDEFAYVRISGATVTVRKAKSQRTRGPDRMSKADFQLSKDDILGWTAGLLGLSPDELGRAA